MSLGLLLFIYFQFQIYHEIQMLSVKDDLRKNSKIAQYILSSRLVGISDSPSSCNYYCQKIAAMTDMRISLITENGVVIGDSLHGSNYRLDIKINLNEYSQTYDTASGQNILSLTIPFEHKLKNSVFYLRLSKQFRDNWESLRVFLSQSSLAILSFICIIILSSAIISGIINESIQQLVNSINEIITGNTMIKVPSSDFFEFWVLGDALKKMTNKLHENQLELRKYNAQWEMIFETMHEGIIVLDHLRNVTVINNAAKHFLGLSLTENYSGKPVLEINRNYELNSLIDSLTSVRGKTDDFSELELTSDVNKSSKYIVSGVDVEIETDQPHGHVLVFTDVTRIKELERVRQQFFDNVSHELKTPITIIQGIIESLPECIENNPGQSTKFIQMIKNNTKRINTIIDDLFHLAKLDQGDQMIYKKFKRQDIKLTVERAIASVSNKINDKDIKLKETLNSIEVFGNHGLLEEAIRNIIENAITYSFKGSILEIESVSNIDSIELHIKDYGIGMSPEECCRIFERFYRVDKSRDRHSGGSGLGLAIVKHIVRIHQGNVTVSSTEGEGSLFKITLPVNSDVYTESHQVFDRFL